MDSKMSSSILVMENNPLVLQDIIAIAEAAVGHARIQVAQTLAEVDSVLRDTSDIMMVVLSTSADMLRDSPAAERINATGCKVIVLDGSDFASAGELDSWVCVEKPFSQDSLSSAIQTLLCGGLPTA